MKEEIEYMLNEISKTPEGIKALERSLNMMKQSGWNEQADNMSKIESTIQHESLPTGTAFRLINEK